MQTFLPYSDFDKSAAAIDRARLGKQRLEVLQILNALLGDKKGWANHPATRMWAGYERQLACYGLAVCAEWIERGYKDTCFDKILRLFQQGTFATKGSSPPPWLGDPKFHASHRAALLFKDPVHYGQFGWTEEPAIPNAKGSLPYVWPV